MEPVDDLPDEELVARAQAGDEAAFRVLTERYSARLRRRVERRLSAGVRRKEAASDVLQESYLAAFRGLADFDDRGDGSFARWLATIVERKVSETIRRHAATNKRAVGREVTRAWRRDTGAFASEQPSPSQIVVGRELRESARHALDALPDSYREVIRLLRDDRLSLDEVAARLERSRAAVKMLYCRALARLEEEMGLDGNEGVGRRRPTR